ncbi:DUF4269 domain-containing protein [Neobacillus mesonae]|nr:DUF4269 domain-containing protein [Neobacillus mesonae]
MEIKHSYKDLRYLIEGNEVQQDAYRVLNKYELMDILHSFDPILTGTVPINIYIEGSDLDIICEVHDFTEFKQLLKSRFGKHEGFELTEKSVNGIERMKANFKLDDWEIEIFGQPIPTLQQNAYCHMLIEERVLRLSGEGFREQVLSLKREGMKTEPAFAHLLGLEGDPYEAMFVLESWSDEEIKQVCVAYEVSFDRIHSVSQLVKNSEYSYKPSTDDIDSEFGPNAEYSFKRYIDDHSIYVTQGINENVAHLTIHGKDEFTFTCTLLNVRSENPSLIEALEASVIEDDDHEYFDTMPSLGAVEVRDVEWKCHLPEEPKELGEQFYTFVNSFILHYFNNLSANIKELEPVKAYIARDLQFMMRFPYKGETYIRSRNLW